MLLLGNEEQVLPGLLPANTQHMEKFLDGRINQEKYHWMVHTKTLMRKF